MPDLPDLKFIFCLAMIGAAVSAAFLLSVMVYVAWAVTSFTISLF